jgi:hypothetical protein
VCERPAIKPALTRFDHGPIFGVNVARCGHRIFAREPLRSASIFADPMKPDHAARTRRRDRIDYVREVLHRRAEQKKFGKSAK